MNTGRNDPCPCGSGKKYKHCCQGKRAPTADECTALVALFNAARYGEMEQRTQALLAQYPGSGFCWKALGLAHQGQGKDSVPALQRAAELLPDDAEAHNNLGNALKDAGRLEGALASYRKALSVQPDYALAYCNLGMTLEALGDYAEAVTNYQRATYLAPELAEAYNSLGNLQQALGQHTLAAQNCRKATEIAPNFVEAHNNLGNALKDLGQLEDAAASYRQALKINPHSAEMLSNLGAVLQSLGRFDEAVGCYKRALEIKPDYSIAHNNLGNTLKEIGQLDAAVASYRAALAITPNYADAHNNLGTALQVLGQHEAAVECYRQALALNPQYAEAYNNLGNALNELGKLKGAVESYRAALSIKPDYVDAYNNLGNALQNLGQLDAAAASYRQALTLDPENADAHNNLGSVQQLLGEIDAALSSYRRALALKPDFAMAFSNLLMTLNYSPDYTPTACVEEARNFGRVMSQKALEHFSHEKCASSPERLRVGFVSGDLRKHPVGYFLENVLTQLDPSRVELIAYPTYSRADELTSRIKPYFHAWKPLFGLNDEAAARMIHADGVHVLLDLSGHTAKNRLPVFAWKPAPVQASWLGYFATTGVAEMDYVLADEVSVPAHLQQFFTEKIWYLPDTRWCFSAPEVELAVAPLPALKNGYITFGSFQNLAKVDDAVLRAWGAILAALPNARLRWQCKQFDDATVMAACVQRVQQHGIDAARVSLLGSVSREAYLTAHAEVDVILDTFPFSGGTTTCEALWMGVPSLSLAGDSLVARQGASILTAVGLPDWIAASAADYVDKAIKLSENIAQLAALRAGLRNQAMSSALFDAPRFARNFETALWGMWRQYAADK